MHCGWNSISLCSAKWQFFNYISEKPLSALTIQLLELYNARVPAFYASMLIHSLHIQASMSKV